MREIFNFKARSHGKIKDILRLLEYEIKMNKIKSIGIDMKGQGIAISAWIKCNYPEIKIIKIRYKKKPISKQYHFSIMDEYSKWEEKGNE